MYGACVANTGQVVSIDAGGTNADRYTYSSNAYVSTNIASHFQTAWIKTRKPNRQETLGADSFGYVCGADGDVAG